MREANVVRQASAAPEGWSPGAGAGWKAPALVLVCLLSLGVGALLSAARGGAPPAPTAASVTMPGATAEAAASPEGGVIVEELPASVATITPPGETLRVRESVTPGRHFGAASAHACLLGASRVQPGRLGLAGTSAPAQAPRYAVHCAYLT
jgi:hypothetical protein